MVGRDLMVGDWVSAPYTIEKRRNIQVEEIVCDEINPCWDGMENYGGIKIEYLEPIPLTQEILEKNGFIQSNVFVEWKYENDDVYILWKPFPWIKVSHEDNTIVFPCEYVHELQHALKLCRIEKTIEL